jgi:uncharacterized membrane protein
MLWFYILLIKMITIEEINMVLAFDYLDSMMWSIAASGLILGVAALRLRYRASTDTFDDEHKNLAKGLGVALGVNGLYLFITGLSIGFLWPFPSFGGLYNVLFGGVAVLGGLLLLSVASAMFLGHGLQASSYFALVLGLYLIVDAYSMLYYSTGTTVITKDPRLSAILYLAPAAASIFSVPATHTDNKWLRRLFAIFAFLFAIGWLYFASNVTFGHLAPPAPT